MGQSTILETLSWGLIALATLIDPNFFHRAQAAKNPQVVKKGILWCTLIWMTFDLSLTIGAMYAKALTPNAPSDLAYFHYAMNLLPAGLGGLFLAGILATILSTLDSYLFLSSSVLHYDILRLKSTHHGRNQKFIQVAVAMVTLLIAPLFDGNIKMVWKTGGAILTSAMLVPMVLAITSARFRGEKSFIITAMAGGLTSLIWMILGLPEHFNLDALYPGLVVSVLFSILFQKKPSNL